jgi:hypothetical protein
MRLEGAQECRDGGEQPLLQADEAELGKGGLVGRKGGETLLAQLAIGRQAAPQIERGRVFRQVSE